MAYKITRNRLVADSYNSLKEAPVNNYSGLIFPVFKSLNMYVPKSTIGAIDHIKEPSSALITLSEDFIFNTNSFNRYLPNIMSYLPLADSYT